MLGEDGVQRAAVVQAAAHHDGEILHVGPVFEEGPTIERLHRFIAERGSLAGKHHELYLGDPNRAAPERLKTILRQPIAGPGAAG